MAHPLDGDSTLQAMEPHDSEAKIVLMPSVRSPASSADLELVRPAKTIEDPGQHHCADHNYFHADCAVCKRACANFQPYPVQKVRPVARSFGFDDNLTEEKLRALNPQITNLYAGDPEFSLSLSILRLLMRCIWPFRSW